MNNQTEGKEKSCVPDKYIPLLCACMDKIEKELARLYWNEHQKEIDSPFLNTGAAYANPTFTVCAYSWEDRNEDVPEPANLKYKDLDVYWYKHSNRGVIARKESPLTLEFLVEMLDDCIYSLRKDFGESET